MPLTLFLPRAAPSLCQVREGGRSAVGSELEAVQRAIAVVFLALPVGALQVRPYVHRHVTRPPSSPYLSPILSSPYLIDVGALQVRPLTLTRAHLVSIQAPIRAPIY